jgi:hypothetical protein
VCVEYAALVTGGKSSAGRRGLSEKAAWDQQFWKSNVNVTLYSIGGATSLKCDSALDLRPRRQHVWIWTAWDFGGYLLGGLAYQEGVADVSWLEDQRGCREVPCLAELLLTF